MKLKAKEICSIPNILSYIRLLLIPVFVVLYVGADAPADYYLAAGVVLLSGLTDLFDGQIARRCNMITELGKALDPIADKLTQAAIVFCLMLRFPGVVFLVVLLVVKELFMGVCGLVLLRRGRKLDGAMWFGKVSTAVFYVVMLLLIALPEIPAAVVNGILVVTGFFLALSFALYIPVFVRMFRESRGKREDRPRKSA
ncbi:MAG: CDP-alcohol phosphatidyltransferase family protein [Oscillospiraceae bacterium]